MSYADRDKYGMYRDIRGTGPGPALMGAETLIGDSVVNASEEDLGDIKEIMLDMQTGQVAYAVLAFGGFLGLGEKLFAVPWQALHLDTVNKRMVLDVEKERLKSAPGFDKDSWPDMSDVNWASGIHSFYGTDPNHSGAPSMGPGSSMRGTGSGTGARSGAGSAMGGSMGSSMSAGSAGASSSGGAGSSQGVSVGSGSVHGDSYGVGGSADPRPGHEGDDKDISRIRGSNIG
ncbi:PRC-barrel domain-containing protein [Massilia sp. H6]|uniref:PRC-barrel domain-containing protein n=1 Tax=Massilia sp. H6 TaxID=2970464 RepID=UPI002169C0E1|nr:PRC-barrel domain-containing protein [Massilia sp. H6]UVW27826.1 PRC-barrel domain-containing protein [Massilia sp. H6]